MDKITIIVPVFNGEKTLNRCIESLLGQTYQNIEIIIINDGSTDHSINIIEKYAKHDNRIILINKKNTGVSDSRNIGISKSTGKYICFCDADDIYHINYVKIMHEYITKFKVSIVKCNYQVIKSKNNIIGTQITNNICNKIIYTNDIINIVIPKCLDGSIPCFSTLLLIDKKKLTSIYPTDIAMMEDVVFYLRLLLNIDSMYIINKPLYTIYYNEQGATNNTKNYKRNILNIIDVNMYIKKELHNKKIDTINTINKLNINNLNSISDFIFKYYLTNNTAIELVKDIRNNAFIKIIKETNLKYMNIQRRLIIKFIYYKFYKLLLCYLFTRKIIYKYKRRPA